MPWVRTILGIAGTTVVVNSATFKNLTLYDATDQIILDGDATNKGTLSMAALTAARTWTLPDATTTIVGTDATQTLTNKTLTAPVIATIVNTGTLTLPTSTDTLVGRATTDTFTNKTINSLVTDNSASRITGQNRFRMLQSMVSVSKSADQTLTTNTETTLTFDTEDVDTDGLHDAVNDSRLTAAFTGKYLVFATVLWDPTGAAGFRWAFWRKNGTTNVGVIHSLQALNASNTWMGFGNMKIISLVATDYLEIRAKHTEGVDETVLGGSADETTFGMVYIGE